MRCNFLLWICLLSGVLAFGQTYHFDNYSVKAGLSQSTIYQIIQDQNGYVWLGTGSGVSRFDGVEFKNYSTEDGISANGVRSMHIDTMGRLWFGHSYGGLTIQEDGEFSTPDITAFDITSHVTAIEEDDKGRIWFSTAENGVYRINNPYRKQDIAMDIEKFVGKDGLSDRVFNIVKDGAGELYFVTDVGLKIFRKAQGKFDGFKPEGLSTFFMITTIYFDSKGNTWYGTHHGGLYKQYAGTNKFKIFDVRDGLAYNWIWCITEDADGRIWAGTWGGGISVIEDEKILTFNDQNGLRDLKIWSLTRDREGNMLIGTNETGLYIFKGEQFISYTERDGLSNNQVWCIQRDKYGKLWIGTNEGITIMETTSDGGHEFTYINEESNNFISDDIRFIKEDKNGDLWVGTDNDGVIKIDPANPLGPYEFSGRLNSAISIGVVTGLDVDRDNNLWIGTLDGLIYYEIDNRAMNFLTNKDGLAGNEISSVFCDSDANVWVGSRGKGITVIKGTEFVNFDLGGEITANSITEDKDGNIWIGTDGQGLFISKDGKKVTEKFSSEDGLLANLINLLVSDDDNNVWIGSNRGLNKFDRSTNQFVAYTEQDGFTGIETKSNASFRERDGKLWFGTVKGAIRYNPAEDKSKSLLPLMQITSMKVNLENRPLKSGYEFNYKEKSFYFNFKGIYLTNPNSVKYKYMLEGIDEKWSEPTNLTFASYPALPHGKYTFKVMASNNTGNWNEVPAQYNFQIKPPFWKTWWFYLFCIVFVGSWIAYLIKLREENLKREKKILEDKVAERTAEVVEKNKELASKNKDITDSIRYAERIQRAILPPDEMVKSALTDSFVFYRPKDIVSGDFYWVETFNGSVLYSAVDCTGHGVPGAFMSIVGHNLLDKIVKEEHIIQPSLILDKLSNNVSETLRQKSETDNIKDGMDMALVQLDMKNMTANYAGAHNPIYHISDGEFNEIKADKFAIGSFIRGEKKKYTNHVINLKKGDILYTFSDGFPDQFGGPKGKKYKYKPFKEFLMSIHKKPMAEQYKLLEKEFIEWLGNHEQIDDVIVFGVRI